MKMCDRTDCKNEAEYQVGMRIWSLATDPKKYTSKNCLSALTSICVCQECQPEVKVEDFLGVDKRSEIAATIARMGRGLPNFSSAQLHFEPIIDEPQDVSKGFSLADDD